MEDQTKLTLKLIVDTKSRKVLYAEANKDFVDFLFHILSLPLSIVMNLLQSKPMDISLSHFYNSISSLSSDYWEPGVSKESVLKPRSPVLVPLLSLNSCDMPTISNKFYRCTSHEYVTNQPGVACFVCKSAMTGEVICHGTPSLSSNGKGKFVKGEVSYMIMDNLEVTPMSLVSGLSLISKFNVNDVTSLVEKQVVVGPTEGLEILKVSFETQAVLTTVFVKRIMLMENSSKTGASLESRIKREWE